MNCKKHYTDWTGILSNKGELTVADFVAASPGVPKTTVNARIRSSIIDGKLCRVGRGRYIAASKPRYCIEVTSWMKEVASFLTNSLPGISHCVCERDGNLIVETDKCDMDTVCTCLSAKYGKVAYKKDIDRLGIHLDGYILVGQLITESPLLVIDDCIVPSLEKEIVDSISRHVAISGNNPIQRAMEIYPLNIDRMRRYASRRNLSGKIDYYYSHLDKDRIEVFTKVQTYLSRTDIIKAWVFGSFARGEETSASDLDLLVRYDPSKQISLLTTIRYKLDLEKMVGRDVDLVEEGYLKPFAASSANMDKYLIYER